MPFVKVGSENNADIELHYLRDEGLIADLTVVEIAGGPHNVGWTHPEEVNSALLSFLGSPVGDRPTQMATAKRS